MKLVFEKVGNHYVAEFKADNDFNLHVERTKLSTLEVYQKGVEEGEYDFAWSPGIGARKVIDYDFAALVYPKWIKVVSGSEVISASVNFNEGGGSGSGSGSSDGVTMEYYRIDWNYYNDIAGTDDYIAFKASSLVNCANADRSGKYIIDTANCPYSYKSVAKIACIPLTRISIVDSEEYIDEGKSWLDIFKNPELSPSGNLDKYLIPISKEEFYTMNDDEYSGGINN